VVRGHDVGTYARAYIRVAERAVEWVVGGRTCPGRVGIGKGIDNASGVYD